MPCSLIRKILLYGNSEYVKSPLTHFGPAWTSPQTLPLTDCMVLLLPTMQLRKQHEARAMATRNRPRSSEAHRRRVGAIYCPFFLRYNNTSTSTDSR